MTEAVSNVVEFAVNWCLGFALGIYVCQYPQLWRYTARRAG